WICDPVSYGHDDMFKATIAVVTTGQYICFGQETFAEHVFIASPAHRNPTLVFTKRRHEKPSLSEETFCSAIDRRVCVKSRVHQLIESVDVLRLTTKLIVEAQHFADQSGPDLKRQRTHLPHGVSGSRLRDRLAIECVQPNGRIFQSRV